MPPSRHATPAPQQPPDDGQTPMPQTACAGGDGCPMADRVYRLERVSEQHTRELANGAVTMTRLEGNIDRLTDSVDRLEKTLEKFQSKVETREEKGNKYIDVAISALIQWGVPIAVVAMIWAIVKSGAVAVHP